MWKITFEYNDGSKATVSGSGKDASKEMIAKYTKRHHNAEKAVYQRYPKKDNVQIRLW